MTQYNAHYVLKYTFKNIFKKVWRAFLNVTEINFRWYSFNFLAGFHKFLEI